MNDIVEKARRRLEKLRKEVAELEGFLRVHERLSGTNDEQFEFGTQDSEETFQVIDKPDMPVDNLRPPRRRGATPREIVDIMRNVIRDRGEPMTRGEIVAALEARDVELPVADKNRYIGTIAWRHKAFFTHIEGRGYWVAGEPAKDWWRKTYEPPTADDPPFSPEEEYNEAFDEAARRLSDNQEN